MYLQTFRSLLTASFHIWKGLSSKMNVLATLALLLLLLRDIVSSSFCEPTIHVNSETSTTEIMMYCQSDEEYCFCEIGTVSPTGLDQHCKFYKSPKNPLRVDTFVKYECTSHSLLRQIEYLGIAQSDFDCLLRVTNFNTAGKVKLYIIAKNYPS